MIEALIQGVLLGGHYAILAAGLSLMFGVMRIINLAHGDLAILGAYGVLLLNEHLGWSPWLGAARGAAGDGAAGHGAAALRCSRARCAPASCCRCW